MKKQYSIEVDEEIWNNLEKSGINVEQKVQEWIKNFVENHKKTQNEKQINHKC